MKIKRTAALASILAIVAAGLITVPASAASACKIDYTQVLCEGVDSLDALPEVPAHVNSLSLQSTSITDYSKLGDLDGIKNLHVNDQDTSDALLAELPDMAGLERAWLTSGFTTLEPLAQADRMQELMFRDVPDGMDLSPLAAMDSLDNLSLGVVGGEVHDYDLSPLEGMGVSKLVLNVSKSTDLAPLNTLPNLHTLYLTTEPGANLSPLATASALEVLYVPLNLGDHRTVTIPIGGDINLPSLIGLDGKIVDIPVHQEATHIVKTGPTTAKGISGGGYGVVEEPISLLLPSGSALRVAEVQYSFTAYVKAPLTYQDSGSWSAKKTSVAGDTLRYYPYMNGQAHSSTYQWLRNGVPIPKATSGAYKLTAADVGKRIQLRMVFKPHPADAPWATPVTRTYTAPTTVLGTFSASAPLVSGSARVGSTLSLSQAAKPTASVKYQWLRNGSVIKGATKSRYTLTASDRGKKISARTTLSRTGYATATRTSKSTAAIGYGAFTVKKTPTISGTKKVGRTLMANKGTWTGAPTRFTYQWHRNGVPIAKATKPTYKVTSRDTGRILSVKVTAHKTGYKSRTVSSQVR